MCVVTWPARRSWRLCLCSFSWSGSAWSEPWPLRLVQGTRFSCPDVRTGGGRGPRCPLGSWQLSPWCLRWRRSRQAEIKSEMTDNRINGLLWSDNPYSTRLILCQIAAFAVKNDTITLTLNYPFQNELMDLLGAGGFNMAHVRRVHLKVRLQSI